MNKQKTDKKTDFRKRFFEKARQKTQEKLSRKDASLVHAVRTIDDVDSAKSLLFQRFGEWTKTNFPELSLSNEEKACEIYAEFGCREDFDYTRLVELLGEQKALEVMALAEKSYGVDFDIEEKNAVKALAKRVLELYRARKELQEFVESKSRKVLRNLSTLLEPLLAARLVSLCGGLEKLASMPSSTIQVIGAERALFKHLRSGSNPPKHGIIFQSPLVNSAPLRQRGKIARILAAKLAIAVKADFFTGNYIAEKLKAGLDARVKQIRDEAKKNL